MLKIVIYVLLIFKIFLIRIKNDKENSDDEGVELRMKSAPFSKKGLVFMIIFSVDIINDIIFPSTKWIWVELIKFWCLDFVFDLELIINFFIFELIFIKVKDIIFDLLFGFMERDESLIIWCEIGSGWLYFFVLFMRLIMWFMIIFLW